ncbi:Magnetosome protein MamS [Candidatus Magnetaquicoccaceae bacterium FCR-1]|uniref:Magnetosome protein MamS n=1 Tax=Candidatus Magnetaquiglobus chichijimensis TaxID=3141448 RepID=A0ABQ0CAG0_9PROT
MKRGMGLAEWILVAGAFLMLLIVVIALLPERLWERKPPQTNLANGQVGTNALLRPEDQLGLRMIPVAAPRNPPDGGTGAAGLTQLQQAPTVTFSGTVQQVSEQPQSDGQLHLWITAANGTESRISVGPGWFLKYLGCPLAHDVAVDGSGFSYEKGGARPLIYAKRIRINGKVCQLRNDEGFALWSNKLR